MKQLVTDFASGQTRLVDAPTPLPGRNQLLVRSRASLISTGTERMLIEFGRSSLIGKARSQPARLKDALNKARTDGLMTTVEAIRSKLTEPVPLGYCNAGVVEAVGDGVTQFKPGDRVVSNGPHSESFLVGENLCALIPDGVDDETAAATVAAAIGLQGVRLAEPTIGECVVVIGAGLIGLLAIQILLANGCRVLAIDLNAEKLEIARKFGAAIAGAGQADVVAAAIDFSRGRGADAVLITTATESDGPVSQAANMCRRNGRIILVGIAGLNLKREDFYKKELSFRVSCSYGPGRYDPNYEEKNQDYPIGFVRWTEQRNFEAVLDLMNAGKISIDGLVSARQPFSDAAKAYDELATSKSALAILLKYPETPSSPPQRQIALSDNTIRNQKTVVRSGKVAVIGAGNYASRMLIPALKQAGAEFGTIVSNGGLKAALLGRKAGFQNAASDPAAAIDDPAHNAVVIATRHQSHASLAAKALAAGRHVFVEKPLSVTQAGLDQVEAAYNAANAGTQRTILMVGFNRRFSTFTQKLKQWLDRTQGSRSIIITVNAGAIPPESWVQDKAEGGRIIGEACHFIDLARFLADAPIESFEVQGLLGNAAEKSLRDSATIMLKFANGSIATVHYFANGAKEFPKERVEVFAAGATVVIDNFRALKGFGAGTPRHKAFRQDKGQAAASAAFLRAISGSAPSPIPADQLFEVARVTLRIAQQLDQQ
jgi:predicted dehydrogenase